MIYVQVNTLSIETSDHVALPAVDAEELRIRAALTLGERYSVVALPMAMECGGTTHNEQDCPSRCDWLDYVAWSGGVGPSFREWLGVGEMPAEQSGPGCETVTAERSA